MRGCPRAGHGVAPAVFHGVALDVADAGALVLLERLGGVEKAVVGGDEDVGGLLLAHQPLHERLELLDRVAARLERLGFGRLPVAHGVDGVVVDVHQGRVGDELLALCGGYLVDELIVGDRDRAGVLRAQLPLAVGGSVRNGLVHEDIQAIGAFCHGEGSRREQRRHAAFGD